MEWTDPAASDANIAMMRTLYTSMRQHVSGGAYVNYSDLDLAMAMQGLIGATTSRD